MATTSFPCYTCGNPLTLTHGVAVDWECQSVYTPAELEEASKEWANQEAAAFAYHLEESRWQEGWDS